MYVCVCKAITESQLKDNPDLKHLVGTGCGKCLEYLKANTYPGTDIPLEEYKHESMDSRR